VDDLVQEFVHILLIVASESSPELLALDVKR
jgi:hypothetical protein